MDCKQLRENLDLYVNRELSEDAIAEAGSHLSECAACRRAVDQLQLMRTTVREVVGHHEVPAGLLERVQAQSRPRFSPRHFALVAALIVIFLLGVEWFSPAVRGAAAGQLDRVAIHLDRPRTVELEGKLLCRDDELHAQYGVHAMCSTKGHHGTLQTADGRLWSFIETERSQELIHDSAMLGKTVRVRARIYRQAGALDVESYQVL